jgi:hypothetical protein
MADINRPEFNMVNINQPPMAQCVPQETVIRDVRLAAAYVPYQKLCTLFTPIEALKLGTAFPELYSPYEGEDKKRKPAVKR